MRWVCLHCGSTLRANIGRFSSMKVICRAFRLEFQLDLDGKEGKYVWEKRSQKKEIVCFPRWWKRREKDFVRIIEKKLTSYFKYLMYRVRVEIPSLWYRKGKYLSKFKDNISSFLICFHFKFQKNFLNIYWVWNLFAVMNLETTGSLNGHKSSQLNE